MGLQEDIKLDAGLSFAESTQEAAGKEAVFVTGGAGFVGSHIVYQLLATTSMPVFCIARSQNATSARDRVVERVSQYGEVPQRYLDSLVVFEGDFTAARLALKGPEYDRVLRDVGTIIHCGAQINLLYPYSALRKANVEGTRELLRLASDSHVAAFHQVSSMAVYGDRGSHKAEGSGENQVPTRDCASGYAQSKWASEQLVLEARARGLNSYIHRPNAITGHSISGVCNELDVLSLMLAACMVLRMAPAMMETVTLTPVDDVVHAILVRYRASERRGGEQDITGYRTCSWETIRTILTEEALIDQICEHDKWQVAVSRWALQNPESRISPLAWFLRPANPQQQSAEGDLDSAQVAPEATRSMNGLNDDGAELMRQQIRWLAGRLGRITNGPRERGLVLR